MWRIRNHTPYKADRGWGRDKDGVHEWIVAIKGTFDIKPDGGVTLSDEPIEPLLLPEYTGEPGSSSLRYDSDITGQKPTTDILLNATAYAPNGRPSTNFLIEARVGEIHKALRVVGTRTWSGGLLQGFSEPEPITEVPVVYERAYGGYDHADPDPQNQQMDTRNPVGCGVVAKAGYKEGQPLPNFEYPDGNTAKAGPAGFGAIDSFWSPRREYSGTYDHAWQQSRLPLLPLDWDPRSLLCSPTDQQPGSYLRGGEVVELTNLTPQGRLQFTLPKAYFVLRTRIAGRTVEHRSRVATVIIEPDYPRVIMVWQSVLACPTDVDYLDETVIREKAYI
ncbi:MAG: DUF2169 domain-containing protein [Bryobacterales bacterium]|nr:DUF2169 domain-containing protein [Bryobacterales bacterium]